MNLRRFFGPQTFNSPEFDCKEKFLRRNLSTAILRHSWLFQQAFSSHGSPHIAIQAPAMYGLVFWQPEVRLCCLSHTSAFYSVQGEPWPHHQSPKRHLDLNAQISSTVASHTISFFLYFQRGVQEGRGDLYQEHGHLYTVYHMPPPSSRRSQSSKLPTILCLIPHRPCWLFLYISHNHVCLCHFNYGKRKEGEKASKDSPIEMGRR